MYVLNVNYSYKLKVTNYVIYKTTVEFILFRKYFKLILFNVSICVSIKMTVHKTLSAAFFFLLKYYNCLPLHNVVFV